MTSFERGDVCVVVVSATETKVKIIEQSNGGTNNKFIVGIFL
jgi:hypothetical protein